MAKSYVKFEVSNDVVAKTYEALQLAKQSGVVKKGANEVTKSVERGLASFVVIAGDVEPEEVVIHICAEQAGAWQINRHECPVHGSGSGKCREGRINNKRHSFKDYWSIPEGEAGKACRKTGKAG